MDFGILIQAIINGIMGRRNLRSCGNEPEYDLRRYEDRKLLPGRNADGQYVCNVSAV